MGYRDSSAMWRSVAFFVGLCVQGVFPASLFGQAMFHSGIMELVDDRGAFPFGVASGDPRQEQVVIWTNVLPKNVAERVEVRWEMARDTQMTDLAASGTFWTDSSSAFTVHVTATGLKEGSTYFYRFSALGSTSPIGRTRTAHRNPEKLRFAVASCANLPAGFFNGYALIAQQRDIDAVVHLGDYIYEYGSRGEVLRSHIPPNEIIGLSDYRSRYAQYRLDTDLMEAHRLHPFIVIWDDHENANNSHRNGADNHQPNEGDWELRKAVSKKAYFEWMPVENPESQSIVRSFNYGGLADLFMLEGRLERSDPLPNFQHPSLNDTSRTMLGHAQTDWLTEGLKASKAKWRIIGNNVMFAAMDFGKFAKDRQRNMDGWDGYPANRNRIFDTLEVHGIKDNIIITGDIHTAWGMELTRDPYDRDVYHRRKHKGVFGAEFVAHSISSKNLDEMRGKLVARIGATYTRSAKRNPHLRFVNLMDHGYMLLELSSEKATSTWVFSKTLKKPTLRTKRPVRWHIMHGGDRLKRGK